MTLGRGGWWPLDEQADKEQDFVFTGASLKAFINTCCPQDPFKLITQLPLYAQYLPKDVFSDHGLTSTSTSPKSESESESFPPLQILPRKFLIHILELTDDIILRIAEFLQSKNSYNSLAKFGWTCKRIWKITNPLIFEKLNFPPGTDDVRVLGGKGNPEPKNPAQATRFWNEYPLDSIRKLKLKRSIHGYRPRDPIDNVIQELIPRFNPKNFPSLRHLELYLSEKENEDPSMLPALSQCLPSFDDMIRSNPKNNLRSLTIKYEKKMMQQRTEKPFDLPSIYPFLNSLPTSLTRIQLDQSIRINSNICRMISNLVQLDVLHIGGFLTPEIFRFYSGDEKKAKEFCKWPVRKLYITYHHKKWEKQPTRTRRGFGIYSKALFRLLEFVASTVQVLVLNELSFNCRGTPVLYSFQPIPFRYLFEFDITNLYLYCLAEDEAFRTAFSFAPVRRFNARHSDTGWVYEKTDDKKKEKIPIWNTLEHFSDKQNERQ